jgi:tetratricopeptide (TPR) repeat protein
MAWLGAVMAVFAILSAILVHPDQIPSDVSEQLWRHRNLGKAFYENQTTQIQAVEQFRKALALAPDSIRERLNYGLALIKSGQSEKGIAELEQVQREAPTLPHTWFNLGIIYKKEARYDRAQEQFEQMVSLVPDEPVSHYNLGVLYRLAGDPESALRHFATAARLDPALAGPHFQLYTAYRVKGQTQQAKQELDIFQDIKKRTASAAVPEDLEWSIFAEIYDTLEPAAPVEESADLDFRDSLLRERLEGESPQLAVLDFDRDARPDLLAWTDRQVRLFKNGQEEVALSGLEDLREVTSIAEGDFNNDGLVDLCVLTESRPLLYLNTQGTFQKYSSALPAGSYAKALWMDFDHDNDLDLFLLGRQSVLLRNNGNAGFANHTDQFPFLPGEAMDATVFDLIKDKEVFDLVVSYRDRPLALYRDRLGGSYEAEFLTHTSSGVESIEALDLNNDGWTDLAVVSESRVSTLVNRQGTLEEAGVGTVAGQSIFLADLANRGVVDLVVGGVVFQNQGQGRFGPAQELMPPVEVSSVAGADFNRDGQVDLVLVTGQGEVHLLHNESHSSNHWLEVSLTGVRNLSTAPAAKVEVRAGSWYQKKIYQGVPLSFGLGRFEKIDVVRIIWPNGLIQNETQQPTRQALHYKEKERLSGSCPTVFTWNGREFEFISDMLGAAPLGFRVAADQYLDTDHDEYLRIPGESLVKVGNHYEVRLTEELREVAYLDQIRLLAVDHPQEMDIFTSDKFKAPPFPEFRLFGVNERFYPLRAQNHRNQDVLSRVVKLDRRYPDAFSRDYSGVAEMHALELDFGPQAAQQNQDVLVMNGWLDWADSSSFVRQDQAGEDLILPYLQVKDERGLWQTVIEDMGLPAGRPKTIVVDLTDKFLSSAREVRIVTNLCLYWDEIFLTPATAEPEVQLTEIPLDDAHLRFRGFSSAAVHSQRKQPEWFDYSQVSPVSMWNPTPGNYTRYGQVEELIEGVDDRFVIMGSGDEIRLLFDGADLPPVEKGFKRDFLLYANGWVKDGDPNTVFSQTVEPLPFHQMSGYPYADPEGYPRDEEHQRYQREYNIRPALRLLQPLSGYK